MSDATVLRALNAASDPLIPERTRHRVRRATPEMGYRPNPLARSLAAPASSPPWLWTERMQGSCHAAPARLMREGARGAMAHLETLGVKVSGFDDRARPTVDFSPF